MLWRQRKLEYEPVHGNGGSPILAGPYLIVLCDGARRQFVAALDRETGEIRWRTPRPATGGKRFSFSTPLLVESDGRRQLICPGPGAVASLDPRSGKEIWRVLYPGGYSVVPRPVSAHGLVYLTTGYDEPSLLAIRPEGQGDITERAIRWRLDRGAPHNPSAIVVGDEIYVVSDKGIATCLDAKTGREHWRKRLRGSFSASPIHAAGKIYFLSEKGENGRDPRGRGVRRDLPKRAR